MEICIFPYYSIPYRKTFVKNLKYFYGFLSFLITQKRTSRNRRPVEARLIPPAFPTQAIAVNYTIKCNTLQKNDSSYKSML